MGRHVIKQPDGKFSLFSTICDGFIAEDLTKEDLIDIAVEEKKEEIQEYYDRMFEFYDSGQNPPRYAGGTDMTYDEAARLNKKHHG